MTTTTELLTAYDKWQAERESLYVVEAETGAFPADDIAASDDAGIDLLYAFAEALREAAAEEQADTRPRPARRPYWPEQTRAQLVETLGLTGISTPYKVLQSIDRTAWGTVFLVELSFDLYTSQGIDSCPANLADLADLLASRGFDIADLLS